MSGGMLLLIILGLLGLPILWGIVRDKLGWNTNRFYGDEMNKKKNKGREKVYEENTRQAGPGDYPPSGGTGI
ncbi:hypothetical protein LCM20_08615 [Halobacillus litoralis]|uniref:hypothetical protein n=1 Tax=Halobacillus litoralis TaxID=45668 RepID=UPI001CD4ABB2|nr:hypothetical protein [Halobacillus litoralis]MCA0970647.1 hypothetical protein [Halobacillus litoralis]